MPSTCSVRFAADLPAALFQAAVETCTTPMVVADARAAGHPVIFANAAFETLTGYPLEEILGRNCRFLQGGDRDQPDLERIRSALKAEVPVTATLRNYRKNGELFWNELNISPLRNAEGEIAYYMGILRDVTREVAERSGFETPEGLLREVLDHTPAGIIAADLTSHRIVFANTEFQRMLGYKWSQLDGKSPAMLHPEEALERVMRIFGEMAAGKRTECEGVPVRRSDGTVFTSSIHCRSTRFGIVRVLLAVFFDTTERDAAQAVADEHLARMEAVLAAHPDLIYILDSDGLILNSQRNRVQTRGPSPLLCEGRNVAEVLPPEAAELVMRNLRLTVRTSTGTTCSYSMPQEGRIEHYETRLVPFPHRRVLALIRRITDRRQLEAEMLARKTAEQANRAKGEFLATISHEIRTPLNAIIGFSRNLALSDSLAPEFREQVSTIERNGEHLLGLINDMLDFARIEAGRMRLRECDFNLPLLLREVGEMFRLKAEEKGLTFSMERTGTMPDFVHGDPTKLRQVLVNLLGNAVKFTSEGVITLRAGRPVDRVAPEDVLCFEVADTGPGIPEADLPRLFDDYFQGSTGLKAGGTGLGLPICKHLVALMRGSSISARNLKGGGSSFTFELPLPPSHGVEPPVEAPLVPLAQCQTAGKQVPLREQERLLLSLPSQLRSELCAAVRAGDSTAIRKRVAESSTLLPAVAPILSRLAKSYDYEELLRLLDPPQHKP